MELKVRRKPRMATSLWEQLHHSELREPLEDSQPKFPPHSRVHTPIGEAGDHTASNTDLPQPDSSPSPDETETQ